MDWKIFSKDWWPFLQSIAEHWTWFVGSTFLATVITFCQGVGTVIPHWVIWAIGATGFVVATFRAWQDQYRLAKKLTAELKEITEHPLQVTCIANGLITVHIINKGNRDERIKTVKICSYRSSDSGEFTRYHSVKGCRTEIPCVMPPRSYLDVQFSVGLGTHLAYGLKGYYARVELEDETVIESEHREVTPPSPTPNMEASQH